MWEADEHLGIEELRQLAAREVGEEVEEAIVTTADMLRAEGRSEGLSQGRSEGLSEGLSQGRAMLVKLLSKRFGALPEDVMVRVNAGGPAELEAWFDRGLAATTLAEVLSDS